MRLPIVLSVLLLPAIAHGQGAPSQKSDVILLPRAVAEAAEQWIAQPNPNNAVQLYAILSACISNNPRDGVVVRMGPDQCQPVTDAIAARDKEVADLRKRVADTKTPATPDKP